MSGEPYEAEKIPNHWPTSQKKSVIGKMVAISGLRLNKRGTKLMHPRSRSFPKYSIVEITLTDDGDANPGYTIDSVLYIGFFEVISGGIIVVGQSVSINSMIIGEVTGFSDVHEPNHLNILVLGNEHMKKRYLTNSKDRTIVKMDFQLDHEIIFEY